MQNWRGIVLLSSLLISGLYLLPARADTVEEKLASGLVVTANYTAGEKDKPLILLLHGFLQTHEFTLVRNLADSLAIAGYPALAPTLSLGINLRKQSLACTSIHAHSIEQEAEEIRFWLGWAEKKGHAKFILIAHSAGTLSVLDYMEKSAGDTRVKSVVLMSVMNFAQETPAQTLAMKNFAEKARKAIQQGDKPVPDTYSLSFCQKYSALPVNYLSYYNWGGERTINALKSLKVPVRIIFGSHDDRLSKEWIAQVQATGVHSVMIEGANHFFSGDTETVLLGEVEKILAEL